MAKLLNHRKNNSSEHPQKVAIYIRVSTMYQIDKDSLPMQRNDLTAYSSLILGIEKYEIFEDAGYSGKNTDRPAFQEMMCRVRHHEFSHILVWKIDRISRNLLDFSEMYAELKGLGVVFVSKNEQFDTSTAIGEAMLKIILIFAELERNMTSERVTATMISRASNGLWNGGRIPFGYSYDSKKREFSVDLEQAQICLALKDYYLEHKSLMHTARYLNSLGYRTRAGMEWTPTAVWIIAQSPFYAGIYRYNRYRGTDRRTANPEDEWVIINDHHPAIFTLEEHEAILSLLRENSQNPTKVGEKHIGMNVHIFSNLCYCGKCGNRMVSTPGRLHADGYRTSNYSCPVRRRSHGCDNPTVNDMIIGEFVINLVLNMLNAKKSFSTIDTVSDLEERILYGTTFSDVEHIDKNGLSEFFNLLSRYRSDDSFTLSLRKPRKKKATVDPEIESLRNDKEKYERALRRLQQLYLYSDDAMSEKGFIIQKSQIVEQLSAVNQRLGMMPGDNTTTLSDEDFVRQASHLLISKYLNDRQYIYYKNLAVNVAPEILQQYMTTILDNIQLTNGHVSCVVFKNGLSLKFTYKKS